MRKIVVVSKLYRPAPDTFDEPRPVVLASFATESVSVAQKLYYDAHPTPLPKRDETFTLLDLQDA